LKAKKKKERINQEKHRKEKVFVEKQKKEKQTSIHIIS
jgi:hypothetical protein